MDHPVTGLDMLWMKIASSVGQPELQHLKSFVKTQTKFTPKKFPRCPHVRFRGYIRKTCVTFRKTCEMSQV